MIENSPISYAFGLSYAQFLIMPRLLMENMSIEWQQMMRECIDEFFETYDFVPEDHDIYATMRKNGKFVELDRNLCNYRRGDHRPYLRKK